MDLFNSIASQTIWTGCPKPNAEASMRLFCFPYAGAGSSMFSSWAHQLPSEIELHLVHLPGRDKRIREPLQVDLFPLVKSMSEAMYPLLDKPFAFFGHSMGALLSFEVARHLRRGHSLLPNHLFISSRWPPQLPDPNAHLYQLSEHDFLKATESLYGSLPEIIKQDPEVLKLFLSIMRADLTMLGTYQYDQETPLDCPISVFGGVQDPSVTEEELKAWQQQTTTSFNLKMFPGDHFFIQSSRPTIIKDISQNLSRFLHN